MTAQLSLDEPIQLDVSGMTCAACAGRVERALNQVDGVAASVNYATERALVTGADPSRADELVQRIEKAGYGARVHDDADDAWSRRATEVRITSLRRRLLVAALLTVPLMDITIVLALVPGWRFPGWEWLCVALAVPIVGWAAWPFHRATVRNLRHGNLSMDTLVSLGIAASFGWAVATLIFGLGGDGSGFWLGFGVTPEGADSLYLDVAAGMTTFQLAGRYFETRSRRKAGDVLGALNRLAATHVRVVRDGAERVEPAASLRVDDRFVVLPGETIPADGAVLDGRASVDTSMVTGESTPASVEAGDQVVGGTISTDGRLEVRATSVGAHTKLAQMAALAEAAQARKANVQTLVDRIVTWFVPAVVALAILVTLGWTLAGTPFQQAFGTGIAVLIIACPCALGLATPTALMVGIGRGASLGILVKGQDALEASGRITTVLLDKTGTLTTGGMTVATVELLGPAAPSETELIRAAASVEQGSEHVIARALRDAAQQRAGRLSKHDRFSAHPGRGASAHVDGIEVLVGNAALLRARGVDLDHAISALCSGAERAETPVLVSIGGTVAGYLGLVDSIKPGAAEAVAALHRQGLRTALVTGDAPAAAGRIAEELGIATVFSEVLPAGKADVVRELQSHGERVAMVGDGINDAVALAAADLGMAVVSGSDIALRSRAKRSERFGRTSAGRSDTTSPPSRSLLPGCSTRSSPRLRWRSLRSSSCRTASAFRDSVGRSDAGGVPVRRPYDSAMTSDAHRVDDPNGEWWDEGPIFSVRRAGAAATTLRPGAEPGRVSPWLPVVWAATAAYWVGFAYLVIPSILSHEVAPAAIEMRNQWWWYVLVVIAVVVLVGFGVFGVGRVADRGFGQQRASLLAIATAVAAGFAIGAGIHLSHLFAYHEAVSAGVEPRSNAVPDGLILIIVAGLGAMTFVVCAIALPFVIWSAVAAQREIARYRRSGARYEATLVVVDFRAERIGSFSQFDVTARFETSAGVHRVRARMAAVPSRVPIVGSPVLVMIAADAGDLPTGDVPPKSRGILIEPDPARALEFEPDAQRYLVQADGGS
ncbi:MAG: heavy metal translocating P-type ATPase [Pseudoclavibacter sp.]